MTKVCFQFIFPLKERRVTSCSVSTRSLKISYWLICHWRYGHINIHRKFKSGVVAFKWKMVQIRTKKIILHSAFQQSWSREGQCRGKSLQVLVFWFLCKAILNAQSPSMAPVPMDGRLCLPSHVHYQIYFYSKWFFNMVSWLEISRREGRAHYNTNK